MNNGLSTEDAEKVLARHHLNELTPPPTTHWCIVFAGHMLGGFSLLLSQINLVVGAEICEDLIHEPQEVLGGELIELNQGEVLLEGRLVETIHDHLTHGPGISTHRGAQPLATRQSE